MRKIKVDLKKKHIIILIGILTSVVLSLGISSVLNVESGKTDESEDSSMVLSEKELKFTGNDIITVKSFSSRMFILTDRLLAVADNSLKVKYEKVLNYANPAIEVSDNYGIVFNRGSEEYMIFSKSGIIYEGKSENGNDIIAAGVNSNGDFALSTKSDNTASRVYLYTKKGEKRFEWTCGKEYITALDIASNGKKLALGALGAEKGEIVSKTYLLDIYEKDPVCNFEAEGSNIVSVKVKGKKIISVFLDKILLYDVNAAKGAPIKSEFSAAATAVYTDYGGNTAVLTEDVSSFSKNRITLYNSKNEVVYSVLIDENLDFLFLNGKTVTTLGDDTVLSINAKGIKARYDAPFKVEGAVMCKGDIFVYSSGVLKKAKYL